MTVDAFFAFARERHSIYLRRANRAPPPWTDDPILQQYKFTNVFRELDATTAWFRRHVRDPLRDKADVLLATVLFRWFNSIRTGEAIFCQEHIGEGTTWERRGRLQTRGDVRGWCAELRAVIRAYCGDGPYVSGAYIIKGTDGMDKLAGVLDAFENFMTQVRHTTIVPCQVQTGWRAVAEECLMRRQLNAETGDWLRREPVSLEQMWDWLWRFNYQGPFTAYEVVSDLRHTALLDRAPDINTWANPGPGAARGLARVHGRFKVKRVGSSKLAHSAYVPVPQMLEEMRALLALSREARYWPHAWPAWEMREVEHTLCEFDKYTRAKLGQGKPKQLFRSVA